MLLRANSEGARHELVKSGAIQVILKLFFEYVRLSLTLLNTCFRKFSSIILHL